MTISLEELQRLMNAMEGENLEFKEAKQNYQFDKLLKYCAAIANEGGGKIILGVTDQRPRRITGTQAFLQPERTRAILADHDSPDVPRLEAEINNLVYNLYGLNDKEIRLIEETRWTSTHRTPGARGLNDKEIRLIEERGA